MSIFLRVLLAVYAFCLAIFSAIMVLVTIKPVIFDAISSFFTDVVFIDAGARMIMFAISFIFLVLSLTFLLSGFKTSKDKRSVSKQSSIGEIKISLNSIENIALNTVKKINGIRDTKAHVFRTIDNVYITINVIVMPEIIIPAVSEDIQLKVKAAVEECAGITVSGVKVVIDGIFSGSVFKSRVE